MYPEEYKKVGIHTDNKCFHLLEYLYGGNSKSQPHFVPPPPLEECGEHIKPANYKHIGNNADRSQAVAARGNELYPWRTQEYPEA